MKKMLLIPFSISCALLVSCNTETTTRSSSSKDSQTSSSNLIGKETDADLLSFIKKLENTTWYGPLDENGKITGKIVTVQFDKNFFLSFEKGYRGFSKNSYGYDGTFNSDEIHEKYDCVIQKDANFISIFPKYSLSNYNIFSGQSLAFITPDGYLRLNERLPIFQIDEQKDGTLKLIRPYFYKKKGEEINGYEYFSQTKLNNEDVPAFEEDPIIRTIYAGFTDSDLRKYEEILEKTKWLGPYEKDNQGKFKIKDKTVSVYFKPGSKLTFKDNYRGFEKHIYGYDGIAGITGDEYKTDLVYIIRSHKKIDSFALYPENHLITKTSNFKYEDINFSSFLSIFDIKRLPDNEMIYLEREYFVKNEQTNVSETHFEYFFSENTNIEKINFDKK